MGALPKVSVIIPTYNQAQRLARAIESVKNQRYQNWELVVVDDGSTDNTRSVVESYLADTRIRYIFQENSGAPASPTNRGVRESRGEYIAILQHDDTWLPKKLKRQVETMERREGSVALLGCHPLVSVRGHQIVQVLPKKISVENLLEQNLIPYPSALLIEREALLATGAFDENFSFADDWDMWLRLTQHFSYDLVDEVLFEYHIHGENITRQTPYLAVARELEYFVQKHASLYSRYPHIFAKKLRAIGANYILAGELSQGRSFFKKAAQVSPSTGNLGRLMALFLAPHFMKKMMCTTAKRDVVLSEGFS